MTKKKLMAIRKACKERGVKLIEVTHPDGRKTRIDDRTAIAAAMDALDGALYKQIDALGGDEATSGMREIVRDWMLRDHPEERDMMEDFSETVTFDDSTAPTYAETFTVNGTLVTVVSNTPVAQFSVTPL